MNAYTKGWSKAKIVTKVKSILGGVKNLKKVTEINRKPVLLYI